MPPTITFDCLPLRAVARFDAPLDAAPEEEALWHRIREAAGRHGSHNTYYVYNGDCAFRLTNDEQIGLVEFTFEGTVFTDPGDLRTLRCDLGVELSHEVCEWLTVTATEWLKQTVIEALRVEFDRFIAAGDLRRTIERIEQLDKESAARGGFLGMGL